jgi:hypothetical protein
VSWMNSIHLSMPNGSPAPMTMPAISANSAVWFKARFFVHTGAGSEVQESMYSMRGTQKRL